MCNKCNCPCHCTESCNWCGCVGCTCNDEKQEETNDNNPS